MLEAMQFSIGTIPRFHVLQRELNPHPVVNSDKLFAVYFHIHAPDGVRTQDLRLIRPMLYRLS